MDRRRPPQRTASFPSAPGFRPWLLVLLLSVFLLLFLPSFLSKGIRPAAAGLIKNGWDALNFVLVLFAILCGLLSRNSNPDDSPRHQKSEPAPVTPSFNDGLTYHYQPSPFNRHRRSSSYPDLRQEAIPAEQWRFSDDIQLSRSSAREAMPQAIPPEQWRFSDDIQLSRSSAREAMPQSWKLDGSQFQQPGNDSLPELDPKIDENVLNKNQSLYTEEVRQDCEAEAVVASIGDTLRETPLSGRRMRSSSSYPDLRQEWIPAEDWRFFDDIDLHRRQPDRRSPEVRTIPVDTVKLRSSAPPSPPPPPPPRRRRTARKVPKPDPEPEAAPAPPPPRAPPPPPPLPPPTPPRQHQRKKSGGGPKDLASALAHYYQKKRKKSVSRSKTAYDGGVGGGGAAPPPPPPMPPPPSSVFNKLFNHKKSGGKSKKVHTTPPPPPPPPPQISRLSSPLPPTSPHSVRRRRERSGSNSNLRTPPTPPPQAAAAESPATSCPPSPDVNNKADMFIARFRAGLQLEKQNSMKARTPPAAGAAPALVAEEEEIMVIGTLFD